MYAKVADNMEEIEYVINNLSEKNIEELEMTYGRNYKKPVLEQLSEAMSNSNLPTPCVIRLKSTNEPVGVFGLSVLNVDTAAMFFLATDNLNKGSMISLLKGSKKQIKQWRSEYGLLLDRCHKENLKIQKWLEFLGFKASKSDDGKFKTYYSTNREFENERY